MQRKKKFTRRAKGFFRDKKRKGKDGKPLIRPITKSVPRKRKVFIKAKTQKQRFSVTQMVNGFYPAISHPLKNCSTWYTYYYLAEFADLPHRYKNLIKREFDHLSEELDRAFLDYGTYAIVRELRHAALQAKFRTYPEGDYIRRAAQDENVSSPYRHNDFMDIAKKNKLSQKEAKFLWIFVKNHGKFPSTGTNPEQIMSWLHAVQKAGVDLTRRKQIFDIGESLFFKKLSWPSAYGGISWERIARTMNQRENVTRTIWLDMMWAIQHNTGTWLNKVDSKDSKWELQELLDHKREGRMRDVGFKAAKYNRRLEVFLDFLPMPVGRKLLTAPYSTKEMLTRPENWDPSRHEELKDYE